MGFWCELPNFGGQHFDNKTEKIVQNIRGRRGGGDGIVNFELKVEKNAILSSIQ